MVYLNLKIYFPKQTKIQKLKEKYLTDNLLILKRKKRKANILLKLYNIIRITQLFYYYTFLYAIIKKHLTGLQLQKKVF